MTPDHRRLVALAAVLAPRRALDLLALLDDGREEAIRLAGDLAAAPRHARLAALAAALPRPCAGAEVRPETGRHPLLARLAREAGRSTAMDPSAACPPGRPGPPARQPDAGRTEVRATDRRPGAPR